MKKFIFFAAAILSLSACGNNSTNHEDQHNHDGHNHDGHSHETPTSSVTFSDVDPVCDMKRNENWVEYTAVGADTTWFCSPVCKEQFDANPEKYKH